MDPDRTPHGGGTDWRNVAETLSQRDRASLTAEELDELARAYFWTDRPTDSIEVLAEAHERHLTNGDGDRAALAAWRLFYEHWLVGETIVGRSWLERARSLVDSDETAGWMAVADTDVALADGKVDRAIRHGEMAVTIAESGQDADLLAMALQAAGRAQVEAGETVEGLAKLDRAMILVIGNRLDPHYTGWVYCNVIATCHAIADLRRASEWSESALRWCDSLRDGRLYPGLCRVYAAELAVLKGDWSEAADAAARACEELAAYDERYAGAAHYLLGDLARMRGDLYGATAAFERAHRLGHTAQPGMALVTYSRGETAEALGALRAALRPGPSSPLARAQLACALVDVAVDADDADGVELATREMDALSATPAAHVISAMASAVTGWAAAWRGRLDEAFSLLRDAHQVFADLRIPHEAARQRLRIARVADRRGDSITAQMELGAALESFLQLGATADAEATAALIESGSATPVTSLTARELQVLRLVAGGRTNRDIADELFVSPHTVARHLSNIYAKLGVGSRVSATAWAYDHGLIGG